MKNLLPKLLVILLWIGLIFILAWALVYDAKHPEDVKCYVTIDY